MSWLRVQARRLPRAGAPCCAPRLRLFHAYTLRDEDADVTVDVGQHGVQMRAPSYGLSEPYELDYVWLRDACRAPTSVQASSQQKLFHTSDIPLLEDASQLLDKVPRPVELVHTTEPELVVRFAREHAVENAFTRLVSPASVPEAAAHLEDVLRAAKERDAELAKAREGASYAGDADPYRTAEPDADADDAPRA